MIKVHWSVLALIAVVLLIGYFEYTSPHPGCWHVWDSIPR